MNYESMTVDEAAVAIEARGEAGQIEACTPLFAAGSLPAHGGEWPPR
jgi:hypothetical protein